MAEQLPTDIIIKILSKLPVKSLLRFQCVCKSWQSMIKTPNFIKTHLNQTLISDNSDRHLLVLVEYSSFYTSELDLFNNQLSFSFSELRHPLKPGQPFNWVGSCNGVVCISSFNKTNIILFNPLTNLEFQLPCNNFPFTLLSKTVFGLHYLVTQEVNSECPLIVKFDLRTDTFSLMHCPNDVKFDNSSGNTVFNLTELGGCLCLLINYFTWAALDEMYSSASVLDRVDLWVMKEYGHESSWVRLFSICQPKDILSYKSVRTIVYSKDGRRILIEIDSKVYGWYDLESKNLERITTNGLPDKARNTGTFIGSIVSLEDKLQSRKETLPKPKITKRKKDVDKFLSAGFKLKL